MSFSTLDAAFFGAGAVVHAIDRVSDPSSVEHLHFEIGLRSPLIVSYARIFTMYSVRCDLQGIMLAEQGAQRQ